MRASPLFLFKCKFIGLSSTLPASDLSPTECFLSVLDGGHVLVEGWQELVGAGDVGEVLTSPGLPLLPPLPGSRPRPGAGLGVVARQLLVCGPDIVLLYRI